MLLRLHSRKIYPMYARSNWIRCSRSHFRPLSIIVCVFLQYNYAMYHMKCILHETAIHRALFVLLLPLRQSVNNFLHIILASIPSLTAISQGNMALSLSPAKLVLIRDIIDSESFTISQWLNRLNIVLPLSHPHSPAIFTWGTS